MTWSNRRGKVSALIFIAILLISTKNNKVIADSKLPLNIKRQTQFLEEKRISQSVLLEERQANTIVEGMMSSRDVENIRNAEIEREKEERRKERNERDSFSEIVKSIRILQSKRSESREYINRRSTNELKAERITLTEGLTSINPRIQENSEVNTLLGQLEIVKNLIDKPLPNKEAMDMDPEDIEMLEKIVMAESGAEPYLGQIAVTNVILNRLNSSRYPSTLKGVIFQKSQFSPVKNGVIRGWPPNESVKKAVAEALNGRVIVPEDTLYFVNPVLATDQTIPRTKTPVKVIGSHTFYK